MSTHTCICLYIHVCVCTCEEWEERGLFSDTTFFTQIPTQFFHPWITELLVLEIKSQVGIIITTSTKHVRINLSH